MSTRIDTWREEHANFSRLLSLLEAQIKLFHEDLTPSYELMLDIMYYMTHYPDLFHHPREDIVFAKVKKIDAGASDVVDELMRQHVVLRESGAKLVESLEGVIAGAMLARASIEAPGQTYIAYFRSHMNKEEEEIFPLALKLLSDQDWNDVEAAEPSAADPLFGESVQQRYRSLHQHIAREVGCACASDAPPRS